MINPLQPNMDVPISPKDISFNVPPGLVARGGQGNWAGNAGSQGPNQVDDNWGQRANGGENAGSWDNQGNEQNNSTDQGGCWSGKNDNIAQNNADGNWVGDQNNDQGDNNTNGNDDWNRNNNDAANNGNSNDWNNSGDNVAVNNGNQAWDDGNTGGNNSGNAWNTSNTNDANNAQAGWDSDNTNAQQPLPTGTAKSVSGGSIRELYGPHGPYYSYRAGNLDEPKPDAEEEPRYDVPKALALRRRSTKQVQSGPGYRYYKKRLVPEYIDSFDTPYARFVFKYRTKGKFTSSCGASRANNLAEQLLNEIGITVDVEPSSDQEIRNLQDLDKQALIEMLIRAKGALGGKVPSPPPTPSTPASGSDVSLPVAVDAPKHNYLRYSLPPSRPSILKKDVTPAASIARSKTSNENKENNAAQTSQDWNAPQPSQNWNTNSNGNGGVDSWDRQSQQAGVNGSRQGSWQTPVSAGTGDPNHNNSWGDQNTSGGGGNNEWECMPPAPGPQASAQW